MAQPLALDSAPAGQASGWRKGEDLIDALPYVDALPAEEKQRVDRLIQEEMRSSSRRPADYLKELPPAYELNLEGTDLLQEELERVRAGGKMEELDVTRYQLNKPALNRRNDFAAWRKALDNAYSQLGHQYNRVVNLELLLKFGPKAWRVQNATLEAGNTRLSQELADMRAEIESTNRERKLQQTAVGQELQQLEAEWQTLVAKNRDIDTACRALEEEILLTRASLQPEPSAKPTANGTEQAVESAADATMEDAPEATDAVEAQQPSAADQEQPAES